MSGFRLNNVGWTEAEEALLRKYWRDGLTGLQIEAKMRGRTRNSIIGKAHRLGLPKRRDTPVVLVRKPRATKPKAEAPAVTKAPSAKKSGPVLGVPFPPASPEETDRKRKSFAAQGKATIAKATDPANDNAFPLLDRKFGQCAWPVGTPARPAEQLACGAPVYEGVEGCSYCLPHAQRATIRDITQPRPKENLARSLRRWAA